jgi:hypothetical protein
MSAGILEAFEHSHVIVHVKGCDKSPFFLHLLSIIISNDRQRSNLAKPSFCSLQPNQLLYQFWRAGTKNIIEWLIGEYSNSVDLEIVMMLSSAHDYCVTYLFHFLVVFLGVCQGFRDNILGLAELFSCHFYYFFFLHKRSAHCCV